MRALISMRIRKVARKLSGAVWLAVPLALNLLATAANAESLEIVGYSGYLGEWELTASVAPDGSSADKRYSGALSMKHVGLCTQDGPEEKSGKILIRMAQSPAALDATLWVDGAECSYKGVLTDFYSGTLSCAGRETTPLKLWVK
jgi:hypothetical protein